VRAATFSGLIEYDRSGAYAACTAIDDRFDFVQ
jgi:hypothetical protein